MEVEIVEVGPRDGLQNEPVIVPTEHKVELIRRLVAAGLRRVEVASFAHPKRVPQVADAEALLSGLGSIDGLSRIGLVLNERGMDRAEAAQVEEVNMVVLASETFSQRNQGKSIEDALHTWRTVASRARAAGIRSTVTIAAAFGCPFEGEVPASRVLAILERALEYEPDEVALADTIGVGVPRQVEELVGVVASRGLPVRCHFHNTRNTGYANVFAAIASGANAVDASVGGYGGCPFSPSATGNVATEDVVFALERSGIRTGIDTGILVETAAWLEGLLGRPYPALLGRAAPFPPA